MTAGPQLIPTIPRRNMSTVSLFGGATFPLGPFVPFEDNPILRPKGDSWESANLYNPAALVIDDQVVLLYRAHAEDIVSHIGIAFSQLGRASCRESAEVQGRGSEP